MRTELAHFCIAQISTESDSLTFLLKLFLFYFIFKKNCRLCTSDTTSKACPISCNCAYKLHYITSDRVQFNRCILWRIAVFIHPFIQNFISYFIVCAHTNRRMTTIYEMWFGVRHTQCIIHEYVHTKKNICAICMYIHVL